KNKKKIMCINANIRRDTIPSINQPINSVGKDGAIKPTNVPMKNKLTALSIHFLVRNVSIKYAVTGIKTATVNIKAVVNHCTSVELIAKSLIIFGKAVINKNCVNTDKNAAANVIPTMVFL